MGRRDGQVAYSCPSSLALASTVSQEYFVLKLAEMLDISLRVSLLGCP